MSSFGYKLGLLVSRKPKIIAAIILALFLLVGIKIVVDYFNDVKLKEQKLAEKQKLEKLAEIKEAEIRNSLKSISPFGELFVSYYEKINSANKFDRYEVFKSYRNSVCGLSQDFKNWPMTVKWTNVSSYGGHYALVGFESIIYKDVTIRLQMTGRGAASDDPLFEDGYNNLSRGSDLFNKIKMLGSGDKVLVSGKLMSGMGCNVETGIADDNWLYAGNFNLHLYIKEINKI